MMFREQRTALALALTAVAVIVPCAAWYLVGSREADRQVGELNAGAQRAAHDTAERLAAQLSQRLNNLRDAEARRPFYHYQPFFHDPKGASEGASVVPSPLAAQPSDPLVQVYFQADGSSGRVSLPAANVEAQQQYEQQPATQRDTLRYLQHELERGVASILFAVRGESLPQAQPAKVKQINAPISQGQSVQVLKQSAWAQNVNAANLYNALRQGAPAQNAALPSLTNDQGNVQIYLGALKWRTMYVAGQPSLVALREVTTPQGSLLQGFLVSASGLADFFHTAGEPASFAPGAAVNDLQATVALGDDPWHVTVDAGKAQADAQSQARDLRRGFMMMYLGGMAIAVLAGLCVVWLVWQTERLARQRSQFAASAAHELRTPLAGLRIFSEMLAEGLGDPSKSKDYARRVADEAERLGRVVANVLGFTRIERGTLQVRPERGDLGAAVRECIARQQPALEAAGARVELVVANDLPLVKFDRDAVGQILQNLLDNAEKHTRHAGNRTIHVTVTNADGGVELSVADHGPGIPGALRHHLFEAFARGNHTDAPAGLGLGLVLVKALAKAQGATVSYRDNDGSGAVFTVKF
jgi:signal transduction histidine kinase